MTVIIWSWFDIFPVLAEIADPVPVGLVSQHSSLLGRLIQDAEDYQLIHVGQHPHHHP